jgi:integrase
MKTFNEIAPLFLKEMEIKITSKSLSGYKNHTTVFSEWLETQGMAKLPISDLDRDTISSFFIYLATDKDLDRPTCQKYYLSLRKVFQYALKRGELSVIPLDLVVFPRKKEDKSSQVISPEHMKILLPEIKKKDKQLHLACMTEFYTFLRPGTELRLLKVGDLDLNNGTVQVIQDHAKNGHKRIVTIPNQLVELYKEYGIDKADKGLYVFGKSKRPDTRPCSVNMLRWRFNKYRDQFNMPKGYKFYSFKCTGATILHNSNKVSMRELMDQLGHSRLEATQHYLKRHAGFVNPRIRDNFPDPY